MRKNQNGIALIESLLIILILAIIGFGGYYVWHTQKNTDKTSKDTISASQSAPTAINNNSSSQKYITIKEWGVRAKYNGSLHLQYKISNNMAHFTSTELTTATNGGCQNYGGSIGKYLPDDTIYGTAAKSAVTNQYGPSHSYINGYYYIFFHDQGLCPDYSADTTTGQDFQSQTNDAVGQIAGNLEAIPQ